MKSNLKLSINQDIIDTYEGDVPKHIGVIMDGNGRWAQERGMIRIRGHHEGAKTVRTVVESCRYLGCEALTLYAFSAQNWGRPEDEVKGLMSLFDLYIKKERKTILDNGIQLRVIGDRSKLGPKLISAIEGLEEISKDNSDMILQVAVSYGGREEIIRAAKIIAEKATRNEIDTDQIDEHMLASAMYSPDLPDPELIVRTSGEFRVSNFLTWQSAYSEFFVSDLYWPDFDEEEFVKALKSFGDRQRRFGKTGEQISKEDSSK